MNRREFLTGAAGALATGVLTSRTPAANAPAAARPNIVLFVTDDHGAWALEGMGHGEIRAPGLAQLARDGVSFVNAFTPCPVCSPARACLATGLTPSQHGLHDYLGPVGAPAVEQDWLRDLPTLFTLFHGAGYATAVIGKQHMGALQGVDEWFETTSISPHYGKPWFRENGRKVELSGCRSELITDRAIAFVAQSRAEGRPFFLHVGHTQTHSPYDAKEHDPAMVALHRDNTFADLPPYHPHPWCRNEGMPRDDGYIPPEVVAEARRGYYAGVSEIDRAFIRLRAALQEHGCADNTIVIYTSDHGCAQGHNGIWGKGNSTRPLNMFESSLRVPLIVCDPRADAGGRRIEQAVTHYDTFQSLLEFGGIACPAGQVYPGHSWRSLLASGAAQWDDAIYGEYGDLRMIRTPRWKFVERHPHGPYDLFDLENDPGETANVAGANFTRKVQDELTQRLRDWYGRHEDPRYSGLRVKELPSHNPREAWRDGIRERRGLQYYC